MNNDFDILVKKLDTFIRKYYKNQIIRGFILSVALILSLFLLIDIFEYFAWNNTLTRAVLFYSFVALAFFLLVFYIFFPALKLLRIGKSISEQEAAQIIGAHFPEVKDKLLNTLQLQNMNQQAISRGEMELLAAGIGQKAAELKPIPFRKAIDFKKNFHYLRYAAPPVLVVLLIFIISPAFITGPSKRIVQHGVHFEKPLPYSLTLTNKSLEVLQRDNFTVRVKAEGEEIPAMVFIRSGNNKYLMQQVRPGMFNYTFVDMKADVYFRLETEDLSSKNYRLKVIPKPVIFNFNVGLNYPPYLNKKNETIESSGDLVVPEGTTIAWKIFTRDTRHIIFRTGHEKQLLSPEKSNVFIFTKQAVNNFFYSLMPENEFVSGIDSLMFSVQVVKDEFPRIKVAEFNEKAMLGFIHFNGQVSDDHGFHSLRFFYQKDSMGPASFQYKNIRVDADVAQQYFAYSVRADSFDLQPGEGMSYYFEVRDNDAVNGFKRTKSPTFYLKMPDVSEIEDNISKSSDEVKNSLTEAIKELEEVNRQLEQQRFSLFEKKELSWSDKQKIAELLQKEESIREQIRQLDKLNKEINELEEKMKRKMDPEMLEKMKELEEMFADLMNEEMKKQLAEMEKQLEKMNKDELTDFLEKMKKRNEEMKSNLEQNLELFKEMEFEKMFKEAVDQLKELAKKQEALAKKTADKKLGKETAVKKQEEINKEFDKVADKLDEAETLNKELEQPFNVQNDSAGMQDIKKDLDEASSKLQKGKQKKASGNQMDAAGKMDKMASDLSAMMQSAQMERLAEDAQQVRNMLDNLIDLSFKQEQLFTDIGETSQNDPKYVGQTAKLKDLKDDFKIVHDSLLALSKRQATIKPYIVKESGKVNQYMEAAIGMMQERKKGPAQSQQQYSMTSMNNLALMLAESLDQMKQSMQMQNSKPGQGKCNNPGMGSSPSLKEMLQMQQQMNGRMQGKAKKKGLGGKEGLNAQSKELARMAAMQGEIRRRMQQYIDELERNGMNGSSFSKLAEDMQKIEDDIINRRITEQTLERQKQLEVRLLKSEKAEQEREKKKERESEAGKNVKRSNQNSILQYKDEKANQQEILILSPIEMSPYYRALLNKYLYKLERENGKQ
ncbi:MAG: hypothetical protein L3J31_02200 [Bacteroidales bacterium]|nr:hypothetical protein [Bacteroidales bacterium]